MAIAGTLDGQAVQFDFFYGPSLGWYVYEPDSPTPHPASVQTVIDGVDASNDIVGITYSNMNQAISEVATELSAMTAESIDNSTLQDHSIILNKLIILGDEMKRVVTLGPPEA